MTVLRLIAKPALLCLLLNPLLAYSQERILAVMSNSGEIYQDFYSALAKNLDKELQISKIKYSELNSETLNNYEIVVSVGYKAAKVLSKYNSNAKIIYSLIPDDELLQKNLPCPVESCYKVYINQPVDRYLKLYKALFLDGEDEGKNLVFATTGAYSKLLQRINVSAKKYAVRYKIIVIEKNENIPRSFINNLNNNDVLLALPNSAIYNANNAKSIILTTYHANVPIIAYSKSFAKAGSLISLYSSIENIAEYTNCCSAQPYWQRNPGVGLILCSGCR